MKRYKDYLIASIGIMMLLSCKDQEEEVVGTPEEVLPGLWKIESVQLTDYENGVTFEGSTYYHDTTLLDVGSFQMATFSLDSLEALDLEQHRVECLVETNGGQMEVSLNSLFMSGTELMAAIRYNGPDGYQLIDTPVEEFYSTSHIFNNNYIVMILDNHHVQLFTFNEEENHVITLGRF